MNEADPIALAELADHPPGLEYKEPRMKFSPKRCPFCGCGLDLLDDNEQPATWVHPGSGPTMDVDEADCMLGGALITAYDLPYWQRRVVPPAWLSELCWVVPFVIAFIFIAWLNHTPPREIEDRRLPISTIEGNAK